MPARMALPSPPREAFTGRLRQRAALAGSETDWNCGEIRTLCHLRNHLRNLSVSLGAGDCVPLRKVSPVLAL